MNTQHLLFSLSLFLILTVSISFVSFVAAQTAASGSGSGIYSPQGKADVQIVRGNPDPAIDIIAVGSGSGDGAQTIKRNLENFLDVVGYTIYLKGVKSRGYEIVPLYPFWYYPGTLNRTYTYQVSLCNDDIVLKSVDYSFDYTQGKTGFPVTVSVNGKKYELARVGQMKITAEGVGISMVYGPVSDYRGHYLFLKVKCDADTKQRKTALFRSQTRLMRFLGLV